MHIVWESPHRDSVKTCVCVYVCVCVRVLRFAVHHIPGKSWLAQVSPAAAVSSHGSTSSSQMVIRGPHTELNYAPTHIHTHSANKILLKGHFLLYRQRKRTKSWGPNSMLVHFFSERYLGIWLIKQLGDAVSLVSLVMQITVKINETLKPVLYCVAVCDMQRKNK